MTGGNVKNNIMGHIPGFVRNFWKKWNERIIWDNTMITYLSGYFRLSPIETKCMLRMGNRLFCDFWLSSMAGNKKSVVDCYKAPFPYNLFSLAYWHMSAGQRSFRKKITDFSFGDVLDYGGGIGDLALALAQKGCNVSYTDLNGENMKFAKWLFDKANYHNISVFDVEKDQNKIWMKKYDTIICVDVIEHLVDAESVLERISTHIEDKGRLIITAIDCLGPTAEAPMHFKINFDPSKLLGRFGLHKSNEFDWLWEKK
jgi:2-polyprenyl-3-methyl-5-hydroxy-6-metoxy-1,4-benzoquinol methylase